jgi:FkbM family methyltransferase
MTSRFSSLEHSVQKNGLLSTLHIFYLYLQYKLLGKALFSYKGEQFHLRPHTTDFSVFREIFLDHEYDLPLQRNNQVIVDLGANIGISPLYFSKYYPASTIYAIEADSENYAVLEANVKGKSNIFPTHAAIWNDNTPVFIETNTLHWARRVSDHQQEGSNVQGITLDHFMNEKGIDHIHILKVDIEGSEIQLFQYLKQQPALLHKIDNIIIETHDWIVPGCSKAVFDCLAEVNYNVQITEDKFLISLSH